jgi:hypothetical protein
MLLQIIVVLLIAALIFCFILMVKNNNTLHQYIIIINAIHGYLQHCITYSLKAEVDYTDMKSYDATLLNLFDWGYTNILPKEKFEIIKPFILEVKK